MISTVTTSTIALATTAAIASSLALIGVLVLFVLLIKKELASVSDGSKFKKLSQGLDIGIAPLLIAFILIVVFRVIQILH